MKKALVILCAMSLACCTFGCNKEKKAQEARTAAAATAVAAESITQIEAFYQRNDSNAADPKTALTCQYAVVNNGALSVASIKTSGQCDFDSLKGQLASKGSVSDAALASIMDGIKGLKGLKPTSTPAWDCVAYNVTTTVRQVGLKDCSLNDPSKASGEKAALAAAVTKALGL